MFIAHLIQLYAMLIFIRVLMSWLQVDPRNPIVESLYAITDPYLNIFRRIIPPVGMFDFSPLIAMMVLFALVRALRAFFYYQ